MNAVIPMQIPSENLKAALAYAAIGWHVFPCHSIKDGRCDCGNPVCKSPGKHPISALAPRGQDSATIREETIRQWWTQRPTANIAVFLGQSGLCAVDIDPRNGGAMTIDDLEHQHGAIESDVVQLTGGGGEHRVFQRPAGELPGKLGKGVDLKMNGYIIVWPSLHKSGQRYEWEGSSNPLDGAIASPLPDWIRDLSGGQHQTASLQPAQVVPVGTITDEQVEDITAALQHIDADDRDNWLQVGMALHGTGDSRAYRIWTLWSQQSAKFDPADQYRVWRSFRFKGLGGVGLGTIFAKAQEAGWINTGKNKTPLAGEVLSVIVSEEDLVENIPQPVDSGNVPEALLSFPVPELNELVSWMEAQSREPQRQITVQGVLALASVLCGRIYATDTSNTSALYLMVLAGTGMGKNYVKLGIQQFLSEAGLSGLLSGSGNTSAGAVFSALHESPCHIQITDEIGKHLQAARKQQNGQMSEAFTTLTEAYSSTTGVLVPKNYSRMHLTPEQRKAQAKTLVQWPSITLLGLATPGQVFENLSSREIEDGFLNRIVVVEATMPSSGKQRVKRLPLSSHLIEWAQAIRNPAASGTSLTGLDTDYSQAPTPVTVELSEEVLAYFDAFDDELRAKEKAGEFLIPDLTRRYVENAMRLATCLAVCADPAAPTITFELAEWAVQYVYHYGRTFMASVATNVADNDFHRLYLACRSLIERAGPNGLTERELGRNSRLFASTAPIHRDQVLGALQREGVVVSATFETVSGRGKPRKAWVWADAINVINVDKSSTGLSTSITQAGQGFEH